MGHVHTYAMGVRRDLRRLNSVHRRADLIDELLDCTGPFDRALVIYDRAVREALLTRDIIEASVSGRVWPTESGREILRKMRDAVSEHIREDSGS